MDKEWYKSWFDSPFYYILYKDRNEQEAKEFIDRLLAFLSPEKDARMLDLACGRGRYSRYLASKGFQVVGLDLSLSSIAFAREFETENLTFYRHDMRQPFRTNYFNFVFNFFTSFGYFDAEREHLRTIKNVANGLKPGGIFVLDFFNSDKVLSQLPADYSKKVDDYDFEIRKEFADGHIFKTISFFDAGRKFTFTEKVRAFSFADFGRLFEAAGLEMMHHFGDYFLNPYNHEQSDRLILIGKKVIE